MRTLLLSAIGLAMCTLVGCERKDTGRAEPARPIPEAGATVRTAPPPTSKPRAEIVPPGADSLRENLKQGVVQSSLRPASNQSDTPTSSGERYIGTPVGPELELSKEGSQPGYTLLTYPKESRAELLDHDGRAAHNWATPDTRHWDYAAILDNGDLIVTGSVPAETERPVPDDSRLMMRLSWSGKTLWKADISAHSDVTFTPDGRFAVLTYQQRKIDEIDADTPVHDDVLTVVTPDGKVAEQISLYDVVAASPDVFPLNPVEPRKIAEGVWIDVLRANWIDWINDKTLAARDPAYAPTNVVVACQEQNRVAIVNTETRKVVWAWGKDELQSPHAAQVLPSGNVMIFDNGVKRRWSRILEVDPTTDKIVWQYSANRNRTFFTLGRGTCQRLSGGNTLVCNSDHGIVFEATPSGEIVWQLKTSGDPDDPGHKRPLTNVLRYDPQTVEAWMGGGSGS